MGTGAHSVLPYLAAVLRGVKVTVLDIAPAVVRQQGIRRRAEAAGLCRAGQITLVRADARALPFRAASFDAVTAIFALEHVRGPDGPGRALAEAARVLRPGGLALVTVPFRAEGSLDELTEEHQFFQRHYSPETLRRTLLERSGLEERDRIHYGECLPF